jgi:hypothetical protein
MLHAISWARFGAVLFIGLVIYYGYVFLRFYRRDLVALLRGDRSGRKGMAESVETAVKVAQGEVNEVGAGVDRGVADRKSARAAGGAERTESADVVQTPAKAEGGQAALFPGDKEGETPELFKVMEKVVKLLRQMFGEAAATGVRREELEDRIRTVLSGYRQLVKTPYQVSINNFIQRSCTTAFSLLLSDSEIMRLWDG